MNHSNLIHKMTLQEKVSLLSGANFWNTQTIERLSIPSMMLTDGPHGLRKQGGKADHLGLNKSKPATCFPPASTLANSWDETLLRQVGECLGKEAAGEDVNVLLGPGLNIKRNPLNGRNFEYFSEDPYLSGKLASAMIQGIQSQGVSACPKHFAVNSQETRRMIIDEVVDQRALHELYLEGFRIAVQEGKPKTIMSAYNKVNGTYANENHYLLTEVLRDSWGFDGLVVTDWGGNNDRISGLLAGNALEMPSTNGMTNQEVLDAFVDGKVPKEILDLRIDEILTVLFDTNPSMHNGKKYTEDEHHKFATKAAEKSIVLLKNEKGVLPIIEQNIKIGVIGDFAFNPRYQGAGSSHINPTKLDNLVDALQLTSLKIIGYEKGFKRYGGVSSNKLKKAIQLAENSDMVLLFLGLDEGSETEGVDRKNLKLPQNQLDLLDEIYKVNTNIVLILAGGSPVEMPFIHKVKAILHGYLPGQGGGTAIVKALTGEVNPSGKLAETYPMVYEQVPSSSYYPGEILSAEHRESIYIGYRYFDTAREPVLFPFGYGLSYTTFEYCDLNVSSDKVTVSIQNTGSVYGEEIVQCYIKPEASHVFMPEKELKGFAKIGLFPNEKKVVSIELSDHAFEYYHTRLEKWVLSSNRFEILIGASSRDIKLKATVEKDGMIHESPYIGQNIGVYEACNLKNITSQDFQVLYEDTLPKYSWDTTKKLDPSDIIEQVKFGGWFGKSVYGILLLAQKVLRWIGKPITANHVSFIIEMPLRSVARMSGGKVNMKMLEGILNMMNRSFLKGLIQLIKGKLKK